MKARSLIHRTCPVCGTEFSTGGSGKMICSPECRVKKAAQDKPENSCWEWEGSINPVTGYGQLSSWEDGKRKLYTAHRISFRAFIGEIPNGLSVLHHCDNRKCFNPAHLYAGTQKQNTDDMWNRGRAVTKPAEVHWTKLHPEKIRRGQDHFLVKNGSSCLPRGSQHKGAKLTEEIVREVRSSTKTLKHFAELYGVSESCLSAIRKYKRWKHVT